MIACQLESKHFKAVYIINREQYNALALATCLQKLDATVREYRWLFHQLQSYRLMMALRKERRPMAISLGLSQYTGFNVCIFGFARYDFLFILSVFYIFKLDFNGCI